jgi:GTP-binding protein
VFVDQIKVYARAGKGGDGSVHFHRGKFRPKGGPDGGDGGWGGDVVLEVDPSTDSLKTFFFKGRLIAPDGAAGSGNVCTGKSGENAIFKVPPGTLITRRTEIEDEKTGKVIEHIETVADLTQTGTQFVLCNER